MTRLHRLLALRLALAGARAVCSGLEQLAEAASLALALLDQQAGRDVVELVTRLEREKRAN